MNPAGDPAVLLARRLRALRTDGLGGTRVTQRDLGEALSASGPSISSWEREDEPKTPPRARLADYAAFFATARSVERRPFRVLPAAQLTQEERTRHDELLHELTTLWDEARGHHTAAATVDVFAHGHWHFPPGEDITIVCSALPGEYLAPIPATDPDDPDHVELYRIADLDALMELFGHLRAANPHSDVHVRVPAEVTRDDYATHLVLLGGVDWNTITAELLHRLEVPVRQLPREGDEVGGFVVGEDEVLFEPRIRQEGDRRVLVEDVAHFFRAPSPLNDARTVTVCNGSFARGTYGMVRALTDRKFRVRNETYLRERFGGEPTFSVVSRVEVFLGNTVTPDWSAHSVLHEWPVRSA